MNMQIHLSKRYAKPLGFFIALIFFMALFHQDFNNLKRIIKEEQKLGELIKTEEKMNALLSSDISKLHKDNVIELIARQRLGLIKPQEIPYKILYTE